MFTNRPSSLCWVTLGVVLLHVSLCFLSWNPQDITYISDEASYLVLGKSLAFDGEYRSISWPEEPKHVKYPPIFPLLLSVIWRMFPDFPQNVPWFRALNIFLGSLSLCVLSGLLTSSCSLSRTEWKTILLLLAVHPAILFYSESIHSEPLYLVLSGGVLRYAPVARRPERLPEFPWLGLWMGTLTGLLLYVRLAAVTLALAVLLYLLILNKYRDFLLAGIIQAAFLAPWLLWIGLNSDEMSHRGFVFYLDYFRDWRNVVHDHGLAAMLWTNAISLFFGIPKVCFFPFQTDTELITQLTFWLGLPFHYFLWRGLVLSWKEGVTRLFHLYTLSSLMVFLAWPYIAQERFLGMLLPFFYLFFLKGLRIEHPHRLVGTARNHRLSSTAFLLMTAALLISLGVHAVRYVHQAIRNQTASEQRLDAYACFEWIRQQTSTRTTLMADLDGLFYLHTDRKALPLALILQRQQGIWKVSDSGVFHTGASYLILGRDDFWVLGPGLRAELRRIITSHFAGNPSLYHREFTSPHERYEIYTFSQDKGSMR